MITTSREALQVTALAAGVAAVGLLCATQASAAMPDPTSISIGSTAKLSGDGGRISHEQSVAVPVTLNCPVDAGQRDLSITVWQGDRPGLPGQFVTADMPVTCDGTTKSFVVNLNQGFGRPALTLGAAKVEYTVNNVQGLNGQQDITLVGR